MKNRTIILLTFLIITLIVAGNTVYRVYESHVNKENLVKEKLITEAAMLCFNEDKCTGTSVSIKELINKGYLKENIINPKTKTYYSEKTYVNKDKNEYRLVIV